MRGTGRFLLDVFGEIRSKVSVARRKADLVCSLSGRTVRDIQKPGELGRRLTRATFDDIRGCRDDSASELQPKAELLIRRKAASCLMHGNREVIGCAKCLQFGVIPHDWEPGAARQIIQCAFDANTRRNSRYSYAPRDSRSSHQRSWTV